MKISVFGKLFILLVSLTLQNCSATNQFKRKNLKQQKLSSITLTGYQLNSYNGENINSYLNELKKLNLNTASFLYTCHVKNSESTSVFCDSQNTPKLKGLSRAIEMAKKRNFIVTVRHYIDLQDGTWRCKWNPKDKVKTIKSIGAHLSSFSKFLEKRKVELFIFGAEYCQLTSNRYKDEWIKVIKNVRQNYNGKLTYGANWGPINGSVEFKNVSFWKELDYIGIDHYMPIPEKTTRVKIRKLQNNMFKEYQKISNKFKKPILITELGFPGVEAGNLAPYEWRTLGKSDEALQDDLYSETLKVISLQPNVNGIFVWRKLATNQKDMEKYKPDETGYALYKRKAWFSIKDFFKNTYHYKKSFINGNNSSIKWNSGQIQKSPNEIKFITDGKSTPLFSEHTIHKNDKLSLNLHNIFFEFKISDISNVQGFEIRFSNNKDFKNYYYYSFPFFKDYHFNPIQNDSWTQYGISLANLKKHNSPGLNPKYVSIYLNDTGKKVELDLRSFTLEKKRIPGLVSITFDDGHKDNLIAAKILKNHNLRATAYIMPRSVGKKDRLTLSDLKSLKEDFNWHIDSHHEIPFTEFTEKQRETEINHITSYLSDHLLNQQSYHFAYPLGKTSPKFLSQIKKHFSTARIAGAGIETLPPANKHMMRTFNVLNTTTMKELKRVIDSSIKSNQWLILMFHLLDDNPKDQISFPIKRFKELANYLQTNKIEPLTIQEVWNRYLK